MPMRSREQRSGEAGGRCAGFTLGRDGGIAAVILAHDGLSRWRPSPLSGNAGAGVRPPAQRGRPRSPRIIADDIRLELVSSRARVRQRRRGQPATRRVLDLDGAPVPLPGSLRLPCARRQRHDPEATPSGHEITGNSLFFTRLAWSDPFPLRTAGNEYLVDVYRWVYYYQTPRRRMGLGADQLDRPQPRARRLRADSSDGGSDRPHRQRHRPGRSAAAPA
jgi:hypothetical protein